MENRNDEDAENGNVDIRIENGELEVQHELAQSTEYPSQEFVTHSDEKLLLPLAWRS